MENTPLYRSKVFLLITLSVLCLTAIVVIAILRDRIVNQNIWTVSATGQGKVSYQPDIANIILGVQVDKATQAKDALDQLNEKINKVIAAVKTAGIPDEDIATQSYYLAPQYEIIDEVSKVAGYNANQQLLIKIRDIKLDSNKISQVIDAATKAGSNQVTGLTFEPANLEALKQEARVKAIKDAQTKAQELSMAAGVKLGRLTGWWENLIQPNPYAMPYYSADGKGGAGGGVSTPTIPTGSYEVIIEMNLSYRIK